MRPPRLNSRLFILLGMLVFALAPLTAPGYISGHDAPFSVYFLQMFDQTMRDGALYPRWAADMVYGYGYPLWVILAPLPFFAGQAFHLLGLDFVTSAKLVYGLALLLSALAMYLFASRVLGKNAALVAAIAYAYIPYHLVDLYVRSAQAELVAFIFPPLTFWAFHQLATTRNLRYIPIAALSYAGLLLAHIQSALFFTPIIGLYIILLFFSLIDFKNISNTDHSSRRPSLSSFILRHLPRELQRGSSFILYSALSIALALALGAVFLLPVLFEQKYLTSEPLIGGFFNFRKHFVNPSQLFSPFWGYGYAGEFGNDQFSLQLGLIPVLLVLVSLWAWRHVTGIIRWHLAFFLLVLLAVVFLVSPPSVGLWETFASIIAYLQFPWRLLIISTFALAFLSGVALHALSQEEDTLLPALAVCLVLVTASYPYTLPQHADPTFNSTTIMEFQVEKKELLGDTIWLDGPRPEGSPLVDQYLNAQPLVKAVSLDGNAAVQMVRHGGQSEEIQVEATTPARILFYTRYFPGWVATLDGLPNPIEPYGEQGLILTEVPPGSHNLRIRYEGTDDQRIGALISGASLVLALAWLWRARREKDN